MNKKPILVFLLLIGFAFTACRPEVAVPTLVPMAGVPGTEDSQKESDPDALPTAVISEIEQVEERDIELGESEVPASSEISGDDSNSTKSVENSDSQTQEAADESTGASQADFIGIRWNWMSYRDPDNKDIMVNAPSRYNLEFNVDDTFVYQADCNQGSGIYQVTGDQISLELGSVILSVCPEGSQADQFIQLLRDVTSFIHQAPQLVLYMESGSGELLFLQSMFATTESVESGLIGIVWQWIGFSDPAQGPLVIDDPENYNLVLLPEGLFIVQADCNQGMGTYLIGDSAISISIDSLTSDPCAADSMWEQYTRHLNEAAIHFIQDGDLYIDLIYDSGTMRFANGGPAPG